MAIILESLFEEFCKYLDGKLKWAKPKGRTWTATIFSFFTELNKKEPVPFIEIKEYMLIDYIWRYDTTKYSTNDIELAVEHEGGTYKIEELVEKEIQHLIDIKARNKIGIFYPSQGDENKLIEEIQKRIKLQSLVKNQYERYLIILGYTTTRAGKRSILFKGFLFDRNEEKRELKSNVILQKV